MKTRHLYIVLAGIFLLNLFFSQVAIHLLHDHDHCEYAIEGNDDFNGDLLPDEKDCPVCKASFSADLFFVSHSPIVFIAKNFHEVNVKISGEPVNFTSLQSVRGPPSII
ncbi:MAG: hypothetical protein ACK40G_12975 [Cytophagaceae bacterium]